MIGGALAHWHHRRTSAEDQTLNASDDEFLGLEEVEQIDERDDLGWM
jgi:hypothetical protein